MSSPDRPVTPVAALGWDERLRAALDAYGDGTPGRVTRVDRGGHLWLATADGALRVRLAPTFRRAGALDVPTVGDWVVVGDELLDGLPVAEALLPRRGAIVRRAPKDRGADAQVLAANVDTAFVVAALDADADADADSKAEAVANGDADANTDPGGVHPTSHGRGVRQRRLDRYVALVRDGGAEPVIVLSKTDRATDVAATVDAVAAATPGVDVLPVSARTGEGMDAVVAHLRAGRTAVLLGMSGAGKSTLVNRLVGDEGLATAEVRGGDDRGRHTTTSRQLVVVPAGGVLIDTPGLRELALWEADEGLADTFTEIDELAAACRFGDCAHENEPGCAVRAALDDGTLDPARWDSYRTLLAEQEALARRTEARARAEAARRGKSIARSRRRLNRDRGY